MSEEAIVQDYGKRLREALLLTLTLRVPGGELVAHQPLYLPYISRISPPYLPIGASSARRSR